MLEYGHMVFIFANFVVDVLHKRITKEKILPYSLFEFVKHYQNFPEVVGFPKSESDKFWERPFARHGYPYFLDFVPREKYDLQDGHIFVFSTGQCIVQDDRSDSVPFFDYYETRSDYVRAVVPFIEDFTL